jgi:hypothetical protein
MSGRDQLPEAVVLRWPLPSRRVLGLAALLGPTLAWKRVHRVDMLEDLQSRRTDLPSKGFAIVLLVLAGLLHSLE